MHMRVVAVSALISITVAGCGSTSVPPQRNASTPTAAASSVVTTAENGRVLVGANGDSLYLLTADTATSAACTGACLSTWPPVLVTAAPTHVAGICGHFGTLKRPDGSLQLVYDGHALYFFSGDSAAGMVTGEGLPFPTIGPIRGHWCLMSTNGSGIPLQEVLRECWAVGQGKAAHSDGSRNGPVMRIAPRLGDTPLHQDRFTPRSVSWWSRLRTGSKLGEPPQLGQRQVPARRSATSPHVRWPSCSSPRHPTPRRSFPG